MWEQIVGLSLKTISWGGVLAFLVSIITILRKIQPITTLTSSNFEKTLLTKEKRMLVNLLRFLYHSLIYMIVISFVFYCFYRLYSGAYFHVSKKFMNVLPNVFANILIISSMILMNTSISEKSIIERITTNKIIHAITFLLVLAVYILSSTIFIPSLFVPLLFNGTFDYSHNTELFALCLIFATVFFIYSIVIMGGMKFSLSQYEKKKKMDSGEYFYIQENESSDKWYVYYPTNSDLYLLGDTLSPKDTNVFRTLQKKDLLAQKIYVQRRSDEEAE